MTGRGARGFTLLEIAIALAILGVGIVSVLQIFGASLRIQDRASRESAAVREARVWMDSLLAWDPEDMANAPQGDRPVTAEGVQAHLASWLEKGEDDDFECHPRNVRYHLKVTVTWGDGLGRKSYVLETMRMVPNTNNE